jgi:hypothetical protein
MTESRSRRRPLTAVDRERHEDQRREQLQDAHAQLTQALGTLANAGEWQAWLRFAAGFHRYSFNNTVWLMLQSRGTATAVAGYKAWQAKGRQVRAGEKALKVFAPIIKKVDLTDRDGRPLLDAAGHPRRVDRLVGMRLVSVFDVTATDGPPLPERPEARLLTGQAPPGLWDALAHLVTEQGYGLSRGDCDGANGWTRFDTRQVRVRDDLDDLAATKTLAHELGHILAGHGEHGVVDHRGVQEVEAESVAFMVLQAHGVDASQYTFNYVVGWAQTAATDETPVEDVVRRTGERVIAIADQILARTQPEPNPAEDAVDALADQAMPATVTRQVLPTPTAAVGSGPRVAAPQAHVDAASRGRAASPAVSR